MAYLDLNTLAIGATTTDTPNEGWYQELLKYKMLRVIEHGHRICSLEVEKEPGSVKLTACDYSENWQTQYCASVGVLKDFRDAEGDINFEQLQQALEAAYHHLEEQKTTQKCSVIREMQLSSAHQTVQELAELKEKMQQLTVENAVLRAINESMRDRLSQVECSPRLGIQKLDELEELETLESETFSSLDDLLKEVQIQTQGTRIEPEPRVYFFVDQVTPLRRAKEWWNRQKIS